jgi:hypothetical protein
MADRSITLRIVAAATLCFLIMGCASEMLPATPETTARTAPFASTATAAPAPPSTAAPAAGPEIVSPAGLGPAEVVSTFYTWYLAYSNFAGGRRNPLVDGAYRDTGYLTGSLEHRIGKALDSAGGGFDPILCAQDVPEHVVASAVRTEGERAEVDVRTSFANHRFTIALVKGRDVWQIEDVKCGGKTKPEAQLPVAGETARPLYTPAAPPTTPTPAIPSGWQAYRSEAFGFQVAYPAGWVVREERSVEGQPPIGPESLKMVVMLMPQEWAEQMDRRGPPDPNAPVVAPYTLEVTLAAEDDFWANYPEQARQEQVILANAQALHTVEIVMEAVTIPRYIFRQPIVSKLWVVLTDPVNGFADRQAAYPAIAAAFEEIANSFAWLD